MDVMKGAIFRCRGGAVKWKVREKGGGGRGGWLCVYVYLLTW